MSLEMTMKREANVVVEVTDDYRFVVTKDRYGNRQGQEIKPSEFQELMRMWDKVIVTNFKIR